MGHRAGQAGRATSGPLLVEITGVAGSGKSTVKTALLESGHRFTEGEFIHVRRPAHLLRMVQSLPRLIPILVANLGRGPRLDWPDLKLLVYVTEWGSVLTGSASDAENVLLLDQGPIYALVRLKAKGAAVTRSAVFTRWSVEMLTRWAGLLTAVVWLDAPDEVLLDRINDRRQSHTMKGEPEGTAKEFVRRYRAFFAESMASLGDFGHPEIWRFDTAHSPADVIADQITASLDKRSMHSP